MRRLQKKTVAQLKKEAWTLLSKAIRLEAIECGEVRCITCDKKGQWNRGMQAGHFIAGRGNSILFDERGIHVQCVGCNVWGGGQQAKYYEFMKKKYGQKVIDDLYKQAVKPRKFTREELLDMIAGYKERIKNESI